MAGGFDSRELDLLATEAQPELLAGLGHRFERSEEIAVDDDRGLPFLGHVLAAAAVKAALPLLGEELARISRQPTITRRRERGFSVDPLGGPIDVSRLAFARSAPGSPWPVTRRVASHDTPENALLSAVLLDAHRWASACAVRYDEWVGVSLFADCARAAGRLRRSFQDSVGELRLEAVGPAQLLPLAQERVALGQVRAQLYGDALELAETLLALVDPRRQLARAARREEVLWATLGGLNEDGLQHIAFELWVASRFVGHCRSLGFEFEYPHRAKTPLAVGRKGTETVEAWWQTPRAIVEWPSRLDHEREVEGGWKPVALKPDLVFVHRRTGGNRILCVECKNKQTDAPFSSDLAQAFGYLSHFGDLPVCALVYRGLAAPQRYRRAPTEQTVIALGAPVKSGPEVGQRLFELLAA